MNSNKEDITETRIFYATYQATPCIILLNYATKKGVLAGADDGKVKKVLLNVDHATIP